MSWLKKNKIPIVIAIVQWFVTTILQVDRLFFKYDKETWKFVGIKIVYLIFLIVIWCYVRDFIKKLKEKNEKILRGLDVFVFYFVILMAFLIILWPGTWAWDDLYTLNAIQYYDDFVPWQHVLTGIYQDVLLQILPFPGGIVFLQNIIVSLCVAYSVTQLEEHFDIYIMKNKYIDLFIKIIPFLLPPVLMYQFSGYRMGLYVYLELVLIVMLVCMQGEEERWNWSKIFLMICLGIIVVTWRSESIFYFPCICVCIVLLKKHVISNYKKIILMGVIFIGIIGISALQKCSLENDNYKIMSFLRPCTELVRGANEEQDAEDLADIGKVLKLNIIYENPKMNGEELYWNCNVVKSEYNNSDYHLFFKGFINLAMKYPIIVIRERGRLFIKSSGITGDAYVNVQNAAMLFENNNDSEIANTILQNKWIANLPVFKTLRKDFINFLGSRHRDGSPIFIVQKLVWNAFIPIIILLYAWIVLAIEKKWYLWFVLTGILIKLPIVILTEPSGWFMYILSFYMLGYVWIVYRILWKLRKIKN